MQLAVCWPNRPFVHSKSTQTLTGAQLSDQSATGGWTELKNTAKETILKKNKKLFFFVFTLCACVLICMCVYTPQACLVPKIIRGYESPETRDAVIRPHVGVGTEPRSSVRAEMIFDGSGSWADHCLTPNCWPVCFTFSGNFLSNGFIICEMEPMKRSDKDIKCHNPAHSLTLSFPVQLSLTFQSSPPPSTQSDYRKMKNIYISCVLSKNIQEKWPVQLVI